MTVYCPNCGKPNTDEAAQCISCGTELKPAAKKAAGKFKGTMMMTGPGAGAPPPGAAPPPQQGPGGPFGAPPPAGGSGPVQAGGAGAKKKDLAFQATMLGPMTPPPGQGPPGQAPGGFGAPPPAQGGFGAPPAGSPPAQGGFGAPPPAQGGFGASPAASPPAQGGFGAPPAASQPAQGGFGAPPAASPPAQGGFGAPPAASQPAQGGFGAPPAASQPAQGGFGAPPAASQPAQGGFGAPPAASQPAQGGFGAPPAASQPAQGGFGAPPAGSQPAQGGFGSAPGALPASGGFGGAAPSAPAAGFGGGAPPAAAPPAEGKKGGGMKWVAIGCLSVLTVMCVAGGVGVWYVKSKGTELLGGAIVETARLQLQMRLTGMKMACQADPSGAAAASNFHPSVASALQAQACGVTDQTIATFSDASQAPGEALAGTDQESLAGQVGADPNLCARFTAGGEKIAGCTLPDGNFVIVAMEGFEAGAGAAAQPTAQAPAAAEPAPAAAAPAGGGNRCEVARTCCEGYVAAMPAGTVNAEQACAGIAAAAQAGEAGFAACDQAKATFKQSLEAMQLAVPAACQ